MLDRIVGIVKLGADAAGAWPHGKAHHLVEPFGRDDGDVVVDEPHHLAARVAYREIVDGGIVEGVGIRQHPGHACLFDLRKIAQHGRVVAAVVDDQDFVVRISGQRLDRLDAGLEDVEAVARRNDERTSGAGCGTA